MSEEVIIDIIGGEYDDSLEDIMEAIQTRKKRMGRDLFDELQVGDTVRIGKIKPGYLTGATAEVLEKRISKITIRFPEDMGDHDPYFKWAGVRTVVAPHLVEKVDE